MSPDQTTLTRAEAIRRRKEEEQKRRELLAEKSIFKNKKTESIISENKESASPYKSQPATFRGITTSPSKRLQQRMELSTIAPAENSRKFSGFKIPALHFSMPRLSMGARTYSLLLALFCFFDLYVMQTNVIFMADHFEINGNIYVNSQDIELVANTSKSPSASLNPEEIRSRLLSNFPDLTDANVRVGFPNKVIINVQERMPLAAWQQDGQVVWIDAAGYAFPPREQEVNIPLVSASGAPPEIAVDPNQLEGSKPFLPNDLAASIGFLVKNLPQGAVLIYDPQYGLGWTDPQGFKVYFGNSTNDSVLKMQVYQALIEYLNGNNIKPTIISVEYPNAPYYRVEQ